MLDRIFLYAKLVRLDKPIGTLLLLWPTLWALWIAADGKPSGKLVFIFAFGTLLMRSAGCAINDYADRDFDKHVARTQHRPLTSGKISGTEVLSIAALLAVVAFLLVLQTNKLTVALSFPALFIAVSYPYTKRFFAIPQAYLGIAFGFGIPMAFAAQAGAVPLLAWALLLANIFWAVAYDTQYAMVDRDDDVKLGIHTSAILFGKHDVLAIMLCYAVTIGILALVGLRLRLSGAYYAGLAVAVGMAVYHYFLIRDRSRDGCFKAFRHNNWFGGAIFVGLFFHYLMKS
ncbi:MAG: 4-hydroxybenzoate octaprenyltransferase [Burkholderiales bacterium]